LQNCAEILIAAEPSCVISGRTVGYALLISFWSNELGGEVCNIDELSVASEYRGRGLATALIEQLAEGGASPWPVKPAIRGPAA